MPLSGGWKLATKPAAAIALLLIAFAVLMRLLPHPPNVAPIAAIALLAAAILPRRLALFLPLAAMVISDLFLGLHHLVPLTWGCFLLIALLGSWWLKRVTPRRIISASLAASTGFFLITNFGVWMEGNLYPRTLEGMQLCYVMALPFFRNTLLGDLAFSGMLFGAYYLVLIYTRRQAFAQDNFSL